MPGTDSLVDGFGRVRETVHEVVEGLTPDELVSRLDPEANSIAWLVWHLTRVQDDHIASAAGSEQIWLRDGWAERFALPFEPTAIGYGHTSDEVGAVRVTSPDLLLGYHDAVYTSTIAYLRSLSSDDLARVVDTRWTPPVTLQVRLVSILSDDLQHAGQAAFIRGVLSRR